MSDAPTRPMDEPRPEGSRTPRESPPRRSGSTKPANGAGGSPRRTTSKERVRAGLLETYVGIGGGINLLGIIRDDAGIAATGVAIVEHSQRATDAWLELADQNPAILAALGKFVEGSALAAVVVAHVPMLMPLAQSRGLFGPQGTPPQPQPQNGNGPTPGPGGPHE